MKKISIICLALCMIGMFLFAGCGKKEEAAPAPEATPEVIEAPANATMEPIVYTEPVDVLRLDSIDYDQANDQYLLNVTPLKYLFSDEVEAEQEVKITEGEPLQLKLDKAAVIDFPMIDDLASTVSLLPGELAEEFNAFVTEFEDKPLFIAEQDGETIKRLTYFYQP